MSLIIKQFYLNCLSQASYYLGSGDEAAVIDPRRDIDEYLAFARQQKQTIKHVILTHFHADFAAGYLELKEATGAVIHLGQKAVGAGFDYRSVKDGDTLTLGDATLRFLETPGHTPESICVYAADPGAVFTGDTLFNGDAGRPDLLVSKGKSATELGAMLYTSLHEKLMTLPDATVLYPGHGAGSACGKNLCAETVSTLGAQRKTNPAVQAADLDAFLAHLEGQPDAPRYFFHDVSFNRRAEGTLDQALERALVALELEDVLAKQKAGAQVLDTRSPHDFEGKGHLEGSINVGLGGRYANWAGTVLDPEAPIVLIADAGKERESALRLARIGYDNVVGFLKGGFAAVADHPDRVSVVDRVSPETLDKLLAESEPPLVLDVRGPGEYAAGHFAGALNVPLPALEARIKEVPRDKRMVIHCAGGYRSSIAAGILKRHGITDFADLIGGYGAWEEYKS